MTKGKTDKVLVMRMENGKMELNEKLHLFSICTGRDGNPKIRCHIPGCDWSQSTKVAGLHSFVARAMNHLKGHP